MSSSNLVPFETMQSMAVSIARSGLFGIKNTDQAVALMLIAQAEGLHPAVAARDYHVINGRPALKADAMLARFQQAGGKIEWRAYTDERCAALISHPQGGSVEIEWTFKMAERAGLTKNPTWRQYPRQMLRARVISEGVRTVYPAVSVGVYTPEEVSDFDRPDQRRIRDITPQPEVIEASSDEPSAELNTVLDLIAAAETRDDLDAIKPRIRRLPSESERAQAIAAGIARRGQLDQLDASEGPVVIPMTDEQAQEAAA